MKMKKVGVTLKVTEKTKQPFHNLKVLKKLLHQLNKYIQHFLECHGMSVEANALSTTACRPYCCSSNKCNGTNYTP